MTSEHDQSRPPPADEGFNTLRTEETTNNWLTPLSLIQFPWGVRPRSMLSVDDAVANSRRDASLPGHGVAG